MLVALVLADQLSVPERVWPELMFWVIDGVVDEGGGGGVGAGGGGVGVAPALFTVAVALVWAVVPSLKLATALKV